MKKICVFGASITSGFNDFEQLGWCERLKKYCMPKGIFVFNLGIWGDDTSALLKRIERECMARQPDIIIIAIGGNDSQYLVEQKRFQIPIEETISNFRKIIKISKRFTGKVVLVGLTRVNESLINSRMKNKRYSNEELKRYDHAIQQTASENDLLFIPAFDLIEESDLDDGAHLTAKGHEKVFKRIIEHIGQGLIVNLLN